MKHDLIIRNGSIVDGTGAPARTGDVAVSEGVITSVGNDIEGTADRTIDADGAIVTPGFVDIHSHYDGQATWDERMIPSSWHGVTTVVSGNCGVGFAPVRPEDHQRLIELMEGVEDIPGVALEEGLPWNWQSFPEFLDSLASRQFDVDLAVQVPHAALRLNVMGDRGANREPATVDDIAQMADLAAEAVRAGALGFSTSRTLNHRTSKGEPTPTLTAAADELIGIAEAIGATGQGVLQLVSDFTDVDAEFGLCRQMVERSGRPLSFSLLQTDEGRWRRQLELLGQATADGLEMRAQVAPRPVGLLLGHQCTLQPFLTNSAFKPLAKLDFEHRIHELHKPEVKARILEAAAINPPPKILGQLHRMFELGDPPNYEPDAADSIAARAGRLGIEPLELAYDILLEEGGTAFLYLPLLNYEDGNLDAAGEMLSHPDTVVGLADGGAHVGTICDASFPTTVLQLWGRDRASNRMDLPFLVQRQTSATARTVGLLDRGVIAPGYRADLNVIDFDALNNQPPLMRHDLPAGGRRLVQRATGYVATIVAGQTTYENGAAVGPLPGRLIRGPQPAPSI